MYTYIINKYIHFLKKINLFKKEKMILRREGQNQELKELVNNSRNAVKKL